MVAGLGICAHVFTRVDPAIVVELLLKPGDQAGAGDTVIGLMAAGVGCGLELEDAAALANLGAGLVVRKIGVASVSTSELRISLHRKGAGGRGLVSAHELEELINESRSRGERIVMTNGCFDILHAGHVTYLEEAAALGERLIVAINDDASVGRLKGKGRPVIPVEGRRRVLLGLECVDWVVSFSEDTPEPLLHSLQPEILVKGGDYGSDQVVGAQIVKGYGGEVKVLSLVEDVSTSAIVERIAQGNQSD